MTEPLTLAQRLRAREWPIDTKMMDEAADELDRLTADNKALAEENERWEKRATTGDGVAERLRAKLAKVEAELADERLHFSNYMAVVEPKIDSISAELAEARKREERLQALLVGRDVFIVEHDLWGEFVATLPLASKEASH